MGSLRSIGITGRTSTRMSSAGSPSPAPPWTPPSCKPMETPPAITSSTTCTATTTQPVPSTLMPIARSWGCPAATPSSWDIISGTTRRWPPWEPSPITRMRTSPASTPACSSRPRPRR